MPSNTIPSADHSPSDPHQPNKQSQHSYLTTKWINLRDIVNAPAPLPQYDPITHQLDTQQCS